MKLGDMTFEQIAKLCKKYDDCSDCPMFDDSPGGITQCIFQNNAPCFQQLDLEVKIDGSSTTA